MSERGTMKLFRSMMSSFSAPEDLQVSEWAARFRRLSAEASAEVGAWRNERTPYLVEVMNAFTTFLGKTMQTASVCKRNYERIRGHLPARWRFFSR